MQHSFKNDYLSMQNSNCLKGVFAIAIVICHMFSNRPVSTAFGLGSIITSFGYLSVAFFAFSSGYGLTISSMTKGKKYFVGYLKKRILPIYLVYIILIGVYALFKVATNNKILVADILKSFLFGQTVVTYGWYIQFIILFYLIYYFIFKNFDVKKSIVLLAISTFLYCLVCFFSNKSSTWYESSWLFVFGSFWAYKKECIDTFFTSSLKKYGLSLLVVSIGFIVAFVFGNSSVFNDVCKIAFKMLSAILFVTFVLLLVMKIKVAYKPVSFLGNYFFEIYIVQGIFIVLFSDILVIENTFIYYLLTLICTVAIAVLISPAVKSINKICRGAKK